MARSILGIRWNGVNIRDVNPDGTNKLINLDYFMTPDNFAPAVIQKYWQWKAVYRESRDSYYNFSVEFALQTQRLVTEEAALKPTSVNDIAKIFIAPNPSPS